MKARIRLLSLLPILSAPLLLLSGCGTTPLDVSAQEGSGDIYAQYELSQVTSAAQAASTISALQRLEVDLPKIPSGQVSQNELGALSAQLNQAKALIPVSANTQKVLDDLNSLLQLTAANLSGGNGGMTAAQGIATAAFNNAAVGIKSAIQYVSGQWSITHPDWVLPAPAAATGLMPVETLALR